MFMLWLFWMVPAVIVFLFLWSWLYVWLERDGHIFGGEWNTYNHERFWGR